MHIKGHPRNSLFGMNWKPANVTLVIMLTLLFLIFLLLFLTLTAQPAQGSALGGVLIDASGNLYCTTSQGGGLDLGVVWQITA